jgi:sugar/nucleoside kinase (ribokinase family)
MTAGAERPIYLLLGNVTTDLTPDGSTFGGTAYYSGRAAVALGYRVVVATRLPDAVALRLSAQVPEIEWHVGPARAAATFSNIYETEGRIQLVHARAPRLRASEVRHLAPQADIVHLGPILRETGPSVVDALTGRDFVALTGQGLLRRVDEHRHVRVDVLRSAARAFAAADVSVLSTEDLAGDVDAARALLSRSRVGVLTDGAGPIDAHEGGRWLRFAVTERPMRNPTGTGDVFAVVLFSAYRASGNLRRALQVAADAAARWISEPAPEPFHVLRDPGVAGEL